MRPAPVVLAALIALVLLPGAAAQEAHPIEAGAHAQFPVHAAAGQVVTIDVTADRPVDVALVRGTSAEYYAGTSPAIWQSLNVTEAHTGLDVHDASDLLLIVDNSAQPAGGAPGDAPVVANVAIDVRSAAGTTPAAGGGDFWHALMLRVAYWDLGVVGIGGLALWLVGFAVLAAWGWHVDQSKLAVVAPGIAALAFLWALVPHPGMISQVGLPMLIGAGAGYLGAQGSRTLPAALRLAFLAAFLGALAGLVAGHFVRQLWADDGMLVLAGDRFLDALFVIPATAVFVAALMKVVAAFVHTLDEDEAAEALQRGPPLGATFTVTCLRCKTPITVDRSMKRYRVATDRFEFACPNCHAWMEWAEPTPTGAAAA